MLFENLVSLLDGELKNKPSISSFHKIVFDSKKVKRGDLYFGDSKGIDEALQNGAYGIVSNRFRVKDKEIAWIKVKNLDEAKLKYLRYLVIKNDSHVIYLNSVESEISKTIELEKCYYIDSDIDKAILELNIKDEENLIVFTDREIFKKLELISFEVVIKNSIEVIKSTIFLTTFLYRQSLYKDIKFPLVFKSELEKVLNLFDELKVEYSVEKLHFISHFRPLFLDSYFKLLPFGQSTKVLILEPSKEFISREIKYIKVSASWAKVLLLMPHDIKLSEKIDIDIKYFKNYADIRKLNIFNYNFVIMIDIENRYEKYLQKTEKEIKNTLF